MKQINKKFLKGESLILSIFNQKKSNFANHGDIIIKSVIISKNQSVSENDVKNQATLKEDYKVKLSSTLVKPTFAFHSF